MRNLTKHGTYISNKIGKAIADYNLIEDKDRILVGLSGGKDSTALLTLLNERRRWAPVSYELIAAHIETDYHCAGCAPSKTLRGLCNRMGVRLHIERIKILDKKRKVSCFWCSWNRRKALFQLAEKFKCTKVALGHHKDDIVETLLLNLFYHGEFAAMNPRQELFGGEIVIIRPLCYAEEAAIKKYARESRFTTHGCRCPNAERSQRRSMKNLIMRLKKTCPHVDTNIFKSIARVKKDYIGIVEEKSAPEELALMIK